MKASLLVLFLVRSAAAPDGDAFDHAVAALASGSEAASKGDIARLRVAVGDLRGSGATPVEGGEDVGGRWSRTASAAPTPSYRERALGPGYRSLSLRSGGVWRFEQTFLGGQRARVAIVPTRAGSFTMQVTGDDEEMVCAASPTHRLCDWVPGYTTRFTIELRNPGPTPGDYFIVME